MKSKKSSQVLLCLSSAAMALLGNHGKALGATNGPSTVGYRHWNYSEDELGGDQRYDIAVDQYNATVNLGDKYSLSLDGTLEVMSGASPWYVLPDATGKPVQVMSGATIREQRRDINLSARRLFEKLALNVNLGNSTEKDFDADYFGFGFEQESSKKTFTYFGSLSASSDKLNPSQAALYNRVLTAERDSRNLALGISRVINRNLLLSTAVGVSTLDGYLSDPYKMASIVDANGIRILTADSRPDQRQQEFWTVKMRYYLGSEYAWHLDYRLYQDNWKIRSHTLSTALYKTMGNWQVTPEFRYYNQSAAYFYAPYYNGTRTDGYHSSDYRLSPYGAVSSRLSTKYTFNKVNVNLAYERYRSDAALAMREVKIESPGLVSFSVLTLGVDYEF